MNWIHNVSAIDNRVVTMMSSKSSNMHQIRFGRF